MLAQVQILEIDLPAAFPAAYRACVPPKLLEQGPKALGIIVKHLTWREVGDHLHTRIRETSQAVQVAGQYTSS